MSILSHPDDLKALSHPLRLTLLRHLTGRAATLSQLGACFGQSAAHIRHHIKALEQAGLITPTAPPVQHSHLEKYYTAVADGWLVQFPILPADHSGQISVVISSKDTATRHLAEHFAQQAAGLRVHLMPLNSLEGLAMLRQGVCHMAACHLHEADSGNYNRAYLRHWFPGEEMALLHLFVREEGLMVAAGNPRKIRGVADLQRADVRMINRERGAGTRIWLDHALGKAGIASTAVQGYHVTANSHEQAAQAVAAGKADVCLGVAESARAAGLHFLPLFQEPYELALSVECLNDPAYSALFDYLASGSFRGAVGRRAGYTIPSTATRVEMIH